MRQNCNNSIVPNPIRFINKRIEEKKNLIKMCSTFENHTDSWHHIHTPWTDHMHHEDYYD